jgi:hypothetical protein
MRDVEAAAIEAGISQRYVALALDELRAAPNAILRAQSIPPWKETLATRLFGTTQNTVSVTRRFAVTPRVVLQALGRSLQAVPWRLSLRDTLGGHPLDGGVLVFDVPPMVDYNFMWTWTRYGLYVPEIRVSLAAAASNSRACDVTFEIDLRKGITSNLAEHAFVAASACSMGGLSGALIAVKALLLTGGAAIGGLALAGLLVGGVTVMATAGPLYRWEIRKAEAELQAALASVDAALRSIDIFGDAPTPPLPRPHDAGADLLML